MPQAPFQTYYRRKQWVTRSYRDFYDRVAQVAEAASGLGVQPLRDRVALMLENCPQWMEIYMAHAAAGVTVVPMDPKLHINEILHILRDSQASVIYLGSKLKALVQEALPQLPDLRHAVLVAEESEEIPPETDFFHSFESMVEKAGKLRDAAQGWFARHLPESGQIASILYTSGTTGRPKGAMLSHKNFCANLDSTAHDIVELNKNDNFMIVLPLFHAYSFTANFLMPLRLGAQMCFIRGLKTLTDDLKVLKPTVLMTVPLMAEKIYEKIMPKIKASRLAQFLIAIGLKSLVAKKVIAGMGGKIRFFGVGGAPCPIEVFKDFRAIGFPIIEGYGITECSPGVVYGRLNDFHPGFVGRLIHGMTMRLKDPNDQGIGELQVKGDNVMLGYFNNPEATAEAFDDGWFRTGDLCEVTPDGLIAIRGRKKALIVNREGKNIYPEEVEQCIERDMRIADVLVLGYTGAGETGERVGAIVTPNLDELKAANGGKDLSREAIEELLREIVSKRCGEIADYKRPRKVEVRFEPLIRTSTMKVRRVAYEHALDESTTGEISHRYTV